MSIHTIILSTRSKTAKQQTMTKQTQLTAKRISLKIGTRNL